MQSHKRIKAGIRASKKKHGRPRTALKHQSKIRKLYADGMTKSAIARKLKIGRTSVIRILASGSEMLSRHGRVAAPSPSKNRT